MFKNGSIEGHFHLLIVLMLFFFIAAQGLEALSAYTSIHIDSGMAKEMTKDLFLIAIGTFRGMAPGKPTE